MHLGLKAGPLCPMSNQGSPEALDGLQAYTLNVLRLQEKRSPDMHVILKPVWTYGIQLWGCTKQSNVDIIHRFQDKVLRHMVSAPWYIRNNDLHRDLQVDVVSSEIQRFAQRHEDSTIMRMLGPYSSWTTRA
jgi:hypothetical protein